MLGAVLKAYREYRGGAGRDWLARYWPNVRRLLDHVAATWDPTGSGVLTREAGRTFPAATRAMRGWTARGTCATYARPIRGFTTYMTAKAG